MATPARRRLTLVRYEPTAECLSEALYCAAVPCRYHLGTSGLTFRCAIDVANRYPHGLPPSIVADLLGITESEAQRAERAAYPKIRIELQRLDNEEHEGARRARERDRGGVRVSRAARVPPAWAQARRRRAARRPVDSDHRSPSPAPVEVPVLVLMLCPGCPLRRAVTRKRPAPRPAPQPVDPRQLWLPLVA